MVPRAYDKAFGHYVFIESRTSHSVVVVVVVVVIGWGLHTTAQILIDLEHSKIRKYRQRARSLQIQTPPHTSSGS